MFSPVGHYSPSASLTINDFPPQILQDIFSHLSPQDIVTKAALTCRQWRDAARPPLSNRLLPGLQRARSAADVCTVLQSEMGRVPAELTHLDLRDKGLGDAGVKEVCDWLTEHARSLYFLDLAGNGLSSAGAADLAFPESVRVLNLADNALGRNVGPANAHAFTLSPPAGLQAINLSCNPHLGMAYLQAQTWGADLQLLAMACCDLRGQQVPDHLDHLQHLDLSFNSKFVGNSFPPVRHLDARGTSSLINLVSDLHNTHPVPDLERLLVVPLADAPSRPLTSPSAVTTLALGALAGSQIALRCATKFPVLDAVAAGIMAPAMGVMLHIHTQDAHASLYSRAGKRGGDLWYVHGSRPMQPRALPGGAAALQTLANGLISGAAGAGFVAGLHGVEAASYLAYTGGIDLGLAASTALGEGVFGLAALVIIPLTGLAASLYLSTRVKDQIFPVTLRLSQWTAGHAAQATYDLARAAEAWYSQAPAWPRWRHRDKTLADMV